MVRLISLRLLESYFKHRFLYLLPIVLMFAIGTGYVVYTPPKYVTSGTLYVQNKTLLTSLTSKDGSGFSWVTPAQATVNDLRELLQTDAFVRFAIQSTPLEAKMSGGPQEVSDTITEFRGSVDFQVLGDNLVMFSGKHKDPQTAQQVVMAALSTYVQWKLNADNQDSTVAQDFFAKIISPYQTELDQARADLTTYLNQHPDPVRGDRPTSEQVQLGLLQAKINKAADQLANAKENQEQARLAQAKAESSVRQNYSVIDAPIVPLRPTTSTRDKLKTIGMFLVVGLLLTIIGIVGGTLLDSSLRFPIDVRHSLNLPVLAMMPRANAKIYLLVDTPHLAATHSQPAVARPEDARNGDPNQTEAQKRHFFNNEHDTLDEVKVNE
jgi:capsular polysaccharide biosynthesis protein